MNDAQNANAVRLDSVHEPVLVDEGLAPLRILEFRDHPKGIGKIYEPIRGLLNLGDDRLGIGGRARAM